MKRNSRIIITVVAAAITFGSLMAFAGNNKKMGFNHRHCEENNWKNKSPKQGEKPLPAIVSPSDNK